MPALTGPELAALRSGPQSVKRYLSVVPRTVLATGVVTNVFVDPVSGGVYMLNVTLDAAISALVAPQGCTLAVGTTAGSSNVGRLRIRKSGTGTGALAYVFHVQEVGAGDCSVIVGNHVTLYDEHLIWPRMPRLAALSSTGQYRDIFVEYHDYDDLLYNWNNHPHFINVTDGSNKKRMPQLAGWEDTPGCGYRTVTLSLSESAYWDGADYSGMTMPPGWTNVQWLVRDCTIVSGTVTSDTITIRVPVGFRYIAVQRLVLSGDWFKWKQIPLWTHSAGYLPHTNFSVSQDNRNENGREMAFEFTARETDTLGAFFAETSAACYWEDQYLGGNTLPGPMIRQFYGWIPKESLTLKKHGGSYSIDMVGPAGILSKYRGFAQTLTDSVTVQQWSQMKTMTVDKVIVYILHSYTNCDETINFFPGNTGIRINGDEIQKSDIWSQIVSAARTDLVSRAACASDGAIWIRRHPTYMNQATRASVATSMTILARDIRESDSPKIDREGMKRVGEVRGEGGSYNGTNVGAFLSVAPGRAFGYSAATESLEFQRVPHTGGQEWVNELTGLHYAKVNNAIPIEVKLLGNYDVFEPAWGEKIRVTWAESNRVGISIDAECALNSVSVDHSSSGKVVSLSLETLTDGAPGATLTLPSSAIQPPGWQPPIEIFPILPPPPDNTRGSDFYLSSPTGGLAAITRFGLARTMTWGNGASTVWEWTPWSSILPDGSYDAWTYVPDAFSQPGDTSGWLITASNPGRIYYLNISRKTAVLKHVAGRNVIYQGSGWANSDQASADASFAFQNQFVAVFSVSGWGNGTNIVKTTDNINFTETTLLGGDSSSQFKTPNLAGVWVSSRNSLKSRIAARASDPKFYGTSDLAGWSELFDLGFNRNGGNDGTIPGASLHSPWDPSRNAAENYFFFGGENRLRRINGSTVEAIGPSSLFITQPRNGISTYVHNANRLLVCGSSCMYWDGCSGAAYLSDDALAANPTFTQLTIPDNYRACAISGGNGNTFYFWGGNYGGDNAMGYSVDGGQSVVSQVGNLGSYASTRVLMLAGY